MCLLSLSFNYMFIFKVLTVVCGTLHHLIPLPPSVTRSHTGLFALPGPWGVHLPPQALLCRATLWLHLGLGSSISSSNIYYNHLMSIYSSTLWNLLLSSLPPPHFISLPCFLLFFIVFIPCHCHLLLIICSPVEGNWGSTLISVCHYISALSIMPST